MIISASRRTDIPAYYSDWFLNRIKERYVCVRNPTNIHQISNINLDQNIVDCIVFWSKNPKPMLNKLQHVYPYAYYFQFPLNPYDKDIEVNLPIKKEIIETFKKLSDLIGPQKMAGRYDRIFSTQQYTLSYHIDKFHEFAGQSKTHKEKVMFNLIHLYKKNTENINSVGVMKSSNQEKKPTAHKQVFIQK